ncbi:hypothetical protein P4O66_000357 [Electrophorus voltai]|uniref:Uncharacterized protein n=1 Tax=Electrophorus voltai TaxID=2609070 RepID=A0AAD9DJX6_9TELE|nr:hypothetical protein P4O66_000357 [Electrophorus voltai]
MECYGKLSEVNDRYDLYRSAMTKRRHSVAPASPAQKNINKDTKLLQDIKLAEWRNFMSGFTALHWDAKQGNSEMMRKILLLSQQGRPGVDVNTKSYEGYTPLHIAAIHRPESVLSVLVRDYGANCNIPDNSGKKPYHYLHKDASPKVREMLGDPHAGNYKPSSHEQHFSDLPKRFSTLSKLFQSKH